MAIKIVLEDKTNELNKMSFEDWLKLIITTYKDAQEKENLKMLEAKYEGMVEAFKLVLTTYQEATKQKVEDCNYICSNCDNTGFIKLSKSIICKRCGKELFGIK